jgi:hypothetical protein
MNWRLLTAINAAIALVTVCAVIYIVMRSPATKQTRRETARTDLQSKSASNQPEQRGKKKISIESPDDLVNTRVDDLGAVPAAELTQIMNKATPEQLAMLAAKFNDSPIDARTFGGMAVFFQAWTHLDPKAAFTEAFHLTDVTMRKLAVTAVVNSVSPSSAPNLIAELTNHPDKDLAYECKDTFLEPLIESWSSLDPEAASKFMDELGDTKNRVNALARRKIAYNWGTLDPAAALEWVNQQKDKDFVDMSSLQDSVVTGWCLKDISAASGYVAQHIDDPNARYFAPSVANAMFSQDPQIAVEWVKSLPDGDARTEAESTIAYGWADKDPAAGARWLTTLPEEEQENVIGTIASAWIAQNSTEAFHWISTTTGAVHDDAIVAAMNRENVTPADSLSLVFQINDPERRNSVIDNTIRGWAYNDPEAAETWVKTSALPTEQKDHLLSVISDAKGVVIVE